MRTREAVNKQREPLVIYKHQPRVLNLECSKQKITAWLDDGRKLSIPTTWFTRLRKANLKQLKNYLYFTGCLPYSLTRNWWRY